MKLIEIPEDTNELRDYNKFINTIVEVQKFNRNVGAFLQQTLKDEFFKPFKIWYDSASEIDKIKLDKFKFGKPKIKTNAFQYYRRYGNIKELDKLQALWDADKSKTKHESDKYKITIDNPDWDKCIFYCYETNEFIEPKSKHKENYYYNSLKCEPTDDGLGMIITFKTSYKQSCTPGWLPTYHIKLQYQIDLLTKSIKKIKDIQTETNNNHY